MLSRLLFLLMCISLHKSCFSDGTMSPINATEEKPLHITTLWFAPNNDFKKANIGGTTSEMSLFLETAKNFLGDATISPKNKLSQEVTLFCNEKVLNDNKATIQQLQKIFPERFNVSLIEPVFGALKQQHPKHQGTLDIILKNTSEGDPVLASDIMRLLLTKINTRNVYLDIDDFITYLGERDELATYEKNQATKNKKELTTIPFFPTKERVAIAGQITWRARGTQNQKECLESHHGFFKDKCCARTSSSLAQTSPIVLQAQNETSLHNWQDWLLGELADKEKVTTLLSAQHTLFENYFQDEKLPETFSGRGDYRSRETQRGLVCG